MREGGTKRATPMKTNLLRYVLLLPWLLLALVAFYFAFGGGFEDATMGRYHRKANALFADVSGVTEVKIYLLGDREKTTGEMFPVKAENIGVPILDSVALHGEKLEMFTGMWSRLSASWQGGSLCHEPAYGF